MDKYQEAIMNLCEGLTENVYFPMKEFIKSINNEGKVYDLGYRIEKFKGAIEKTINNLDKVDKKANYVLKLKIIRERLDRKGNRLFIKLDNDFELNAQCTECYRTEIGKRMIELPMETTNEAVERREVDVMVFIPWWEYKKSFKVGGNITTSVVIPHEERQFCPLCNKHFNNHIIIAGDIVCPKERYICVNFLKGIKFKTDKSGFYIISDIGQREEEIAKEYKKIFEKCGMLKGKDAERIDNLWKEYKELLSLNNKTT